MMTGFEYWLIPERETIPLWDRPDRYTEIEEDPWQLVLAGHVHECNVVQMVEQEREYLAQCPNTCRRCHGTGQVFFYLQGDLGGKAEPASDRCPTCIYEDKCPRCAGLVRIMTGVAGDYFACMGETTPFRIGQKYPVASVRGCGWTDSPGCLTPEYGLLARIDCSCGGRK